MDSPELNDDIDTFHLDREKILLDNTDYSDDDSMDDLSEEEFEVLPLDDTGQYYVSDSNDDGSEVESEGSKVGTRAWGSSKRAFYSQQEVGLSSSDEAEDLEEREAIEMQDKMAAALSEADFLSVQTLGQADESEGVEQVALDVSKLAEEDKLALIERTSPELCPLIESLRASATLISTLLPQTRHVQEIKERQLAELKLIGQVDNIQLAPSLVTPQRGRPQQVRVTAPPTEQTGEDPLHYYQRVKELKQQKKMPKQEEMLPEQVLDQDGEKRPITYQISRNKGLTPKRSKEQRNPRVKHRRKFKKALQKRKGQVLPAQTEMSRYGGEVTGIRSNVSRSVRIK